MTFSSKLFTGAAIATLSLAAFAATPVQGTTDAPAAGKHMRRGFAHRGGMGRMFQNLNLTDTQKQYAKDLFQQSRAANQGLRDQLKANHDALAVAVKSNNEADITRLTAEQGRIHGQLSAERAKAMAKFYAQLTPEQKTKAEEMRTQMRERFQQRMQHRMQNKQQAAPAAGL